MIDENIILKEIGRVLDSGNEEPNIDLKRELYDLDKKNKVEKGEFIKDVTAIANSLEKDQNGYLIIGVSDSEKCPDRSNPQKYLVDTPVQSRNDLQKRMKQIIRSYVEPPISIKCCPIKNENTNRHLLIILIEKWSDEDPRPFVLKSNIKKLEVEKLKVGQIWFRDGADSLVAEKDDIIRLVMGKVRNAHKMEIENIKNSHGRQIDSLNIEIEKIKDNYKKQIDSLSAKIEEMKKEIEGKKEENLNIEKKYLERIEVLTQKYEALIEAKYQEFSVRDEQQSANIIVLQDENERFSREERDMRIFATNLVKELFKHLPDQTKHEDILKFLKTHKMEKLAPIIDKILTKP